MNVTMRGVIGIVVGVLFSVGMARADDVKTTQVYSRIKASIDAVPAIDTHDHLPPFAEIPHRVPTPDGEGITLYSLWKGSYYPWINPLSNWPASGQFDDWWKAARLDFQDARATSFYRYLLPAFRDLYGVDFDTITASQAAELNRRVFANYKNDEWLRDVITRRANIELIVVDPYWARLKLDRDYDFTVRVLNVSTVMSASHPSRFQNPWDSPFEFARQRKLPVESFDEFLNVIDVLFEEAVKAGCVCLKSTQAYQRTLRYEHVSKEQAAKAFGRPPNEITAAEQQTFEDFMFWHMCALAAKHNLPFQIHTGQARIQGSNPMLLVDAISSNPRTKFILFHGGFPWVGETGVIAMRYRNVWIDSCWLPTLSYTMAKRAYQEWLEAVPSDRIMWGSDCVNAEGIYGATEFTRQCLAEALAEKVERGELREDHAKRIGQQIMRDNALKLFPQLKNLLPQKEQAKNASLSKDTRVRAADE